MTSPERSGEVSYRPNIFLMQQQVLKYSLNHKDDKKLYNSSGRFANK